MSLKYMDGLLGYVVGDTLGIPLEGKNRETLLENPITKMAEGGKYRLPLGTWSTNTSFMLAIIDSINSKVMLDFNDIMLKLTAIKNHGNYTPYNEIYNVSTTTLRALDYYTETKEDPTICGSKKETEEDCGALIRMLPIAYFAIENKLKDFEVLEMVKSISSLTHANEISCMGCYLYVRLVMFLLNGKDKLSAYNMVRCVDYSMFSKEIQNRYKRIIEEDISKCKVSEIPSTTCIVDVLEASLWLVLKSENYQESIIGAINLGEATSEIASITGSLTGIVYGVDNIPQKWRENLVKKDYLLDIFEEFSENKYIVN